MATMAIPGMSDRGAATPWRVRPTAVAEPTGASAWPAGPTLRSTGPGSSRPDGQNGAGAFRTSVPPGPRVAAKGESSEAGGELQALNALALRCAAGDAVAWEEMARTQHRRVYGICYRFTGSASDAEDLTQEAFLKMYRVIGSFDPVRGGFTTWLATLTRNLLVDNYRRSRLDRASDSLDEPAGGSEEDGPTRAERLPSPGRNQEQQASGMELRAHIQQALKQVSPELREAVILRDLEDMDYKDIAEVLGVPTGTVKSRISRGRSELARLLKRIEGQVM